MPYPPPAGPPELGIFQGIGLVPELPTLVGSYFLTNSGGLTVWSPLSGGVLPDETGHAGEFLTTDGVVASWAPVDALPDQTGHGGEFLTTDGADASWVSVLEAIDPTDIRNFGAVVDDPTNDYAQAFYNATATFVTNGGTTYPIISVSAVFGAITNPRGNFYTSMPLCIPGATAFSGVSPELTIFNPGLGATGQPVPTFAGPVFYHATPYTPDQLTNPTYTANLPEYVSPLVGATGQALVLHDNSDNSKLTTSTYWLHDAWAWGTWMGNTIGLTNFSLQFWMKTTDALEVNLQRGVIGSRGPPVWFDRGSGLERADMAFGVYLLSDGVHYFLKAYLTTNDAWVNQFFQPSSGTLHTITSTAVSANTPIHVELDYNGAFFDFYVNGVNQGHVVANGPIIRAPWEGTAIGGQGQEGVDLPAEIEGINGAIDSIRLSKAARHSGTGSFTPPAAKYTWDSDTYALYNFDQGFKTVQPVDSAAIPVGPLLTLPFLVGQTVSSIATGGFMAPTLTGPVAHYIRLTGSHVSNDNQLSNYTVNGRQGCSGIVTSNAWQNKFTNIWAVQCTQYGFRIGTAVSFFTELTDCVASWVSGMGFQYFGDAKRLAGSGCGIGAHMSGGGTLDVFNYQPAFNCYAGQVYFGGSAVTNTINATSTTHDAEVWTFVRQIAVAVINTPGIGSFHSLNCQWNGVASNQAALLYFGNPLFPGTFTHTNDQFLTNPPGNGGLSPASASVARIPYGVPTSSITLFDCFIYDTNIPVLPLCNVDGFIVRIVNGQTTNVRGLSISEVQANNFAGTFTIQDDFDYGGPVFPVAEPDTDYLVTVSPQSYLGSAPAAGANRPAFGLVKRQDGFSFPVETAPGAGSTVTYGYTVIRNLAPPALFVFLPTIPSTVTNPLAGELNIPFAVGVTVEPNGQNCFAFNKAAARECIVEAGTTVNGTNWWEIAFQAQDIQLEFGYGPGAIDINPGVKNGHLLSLLNPGSHNVGFWYTGGNIEPFFDGQLATIIPATTGTQQTPVYIGERFDASDPLTLAILHNLKLDHNYRNSVSNDNTIGPGKQDQAAFFGDSWTYGYFSTSTAGGFATQIAEAAYGSGGTNTYYWMCTIGQGQLLTTPGFNNNLLTNFWQPWQGAATAPPLVALCVMAGWTDILQGRTAVDIFAALVSVLEGKAAENTWVPPTSTTTPIDQHAFCEMGVPISGSASLVLPTHTFTIAFNTNQHQTVLDAVAQVNGNAPSAVVFTASAKLQNDGVSYALWLSVNAPGTAGNGITCSTNGANGAFMYGDIGGNFGGIANSVMTFLGTDTTCTIAGIVFPANFRTNANTTVDDLVALVNADPTTSPLVTASRVAGQMHVVANANGVAGNNITVHGNGLNTPPYNGAGWVTEPPVQHLINGFNGAISNAIPNILFCNVPPIGTTLGVTGPMITELNALNALINAYVGAGVTVVDVNTAMRDPAHHDNLLPAYDIGGGLAGYLNDAGHTAMVALLDPLLP